MDDIEMARPKGLLILFTSFKLLDILDDAAFRRVVNAMRDYVETGSEPEGLEPIEQVAFESQREALDGNIETYRRAITAHREAGRKGGRPKKTDGNQKVFDDNQTEPIGFSEKPNETNSPLKLKTNNYSDTKVSDSNSAEALPPTPKSRFSPPDVETVKNYFAEKGGTEGQAIRFHAYYESNGWKVGRNPMKNWKAAASGWISRDRDEAKKANAPRNRAFMASRPAEEAENAKNFLADAARRRPLKKQQPVHTRSDRHTQPSEHGFRVNRQSYTTKRKTPFRAISRVLNAWR